MTALNVLGTPLVPCSYDPLTGYYRDGCCNTDEAQFGKAPHHGFGNVEPLAVFACLAESERRFARREKKGHPTWE